MTPWAVLPRVVVGQICAYCGSRYHDVKYCPKTWEGQGNINSRRCSYCGSNAHEYEDCKKHA